MLRLLSKLGVLAAERKLRLVRERVNEPMREWRSLYADRTCCNTFFGQGASRYKLRSSIGLPNFFSWSSRCFTKDLMRLCRRGGVSVRSLEDGTNTYYMIRLSLCLNLCNFDFIVYIFMT
jgi:hypothetical protein